MDVKGHVLLLQEGGGKVLGKPKASQLQFSAEALPTRTPTPGAPHHLLLEQGLDGALPVSDALAQLRLLDELLRGGDEELLGGTRSKHLLCRGPSPSPLPALTCTYHIPSDQLIAQGHRHGICF